MKSLEAYIEATKNRDWSAISKLNGLTTDTWGTKKELLALGGLLETNETVFAFASGVVNQGQSSNSSDFGANTWLVVLTSERFLFVDSALFSDAVDTQSVRLNRVQAVSASQGWVLGKIMVDIGSRTLTVDNCQKADVKVMADLANKLLRSAEQKQELQGAVSSDSKHPTNPSGLEDLERLAALKASGALTDEEFTEAKKRILANL
jgi:hypothetical protein